MKTSSYAAVAVVVWMFCSCSLAPKVPVTKRELFDTSIYNRYMIRDSPESVLAELNREGEAVLEAKYKEFPIYLKILATSKGLQVTVIDR